MSRDERPDPPFERDRDSEDARARPERDATRRAPGIAATPLYVQADALKGRGSAWAIAHRFESREREQYDDGWGTLDQQASEEHLAPKTEIIEERAKKIVSGNQSPDIGFDLSINPYRGCEHVMRGPRCSLGMPRDVLRGYQLEHQKALKRPSLETLKPRATRIQPCIHG